MTNAEKGSITDIAFYTGVIAERQRLLKYLTELNVIREDMVTKGRHVAIATDGTTVVELDFKPSPNMRGS